MASKEQYRIAVVRVLEQLQREYEEYYLELSNLETVSGYDAGLLEKWCRGMTSGKPLEMKAAAKHLHHLWLLSDDTLREYSVLPGHKE